ncbi:ribosomal rna processing protein 1 homolog b-like [Stylonychia lemnae]|uniref:Ribosomal rna processing protein 1 homolog b-like n=1 Tax=Stylonychia lemnae TaxID=5949 RepID=A0A078AC26_STYLE|nr:ribosomal rna processing protein 1 homolog b-like [Stylonychia lemnae]|eukprot:CDW79764.1 ribosomal rna processing protein 1 homolog b-like [Stylonychia lemnae]
MDKRFLKQINSQLAASAQQEVRDRALQLLIKILIQEKQWINDPIKDLRAIWEGLFFLFWHSDKLQYQRDVAEKTSKIFAELGNTVGVEKQKLWFEAFIYIFNLHWDKVDNYRIDKYLMFLRFQIFEVLSMLKKNEYPKEDMEWFKSIVQNLFMEETIISKGIPLQICDIFLQELNRSDSLNISLTNLGSILEPFLYAVANCRNKILVNRIVERVLEPLLENNVTVQETSDSEEEEEITNYDPKLGKYIDGGKLNPKTQREIQKMIDQKFVFPSFNILLYAQDQIFKFASATTTRDENRDLLYRLYDQALKLEPEPAKKELTFSQRMLINRARAFITKKMERRMRVHQQKRTKKMMYKLGNLIQTQIMSQQQLDEIREEANDLKNGDESNILHGFNEKQQLIDILQQQLNKNVPQGQQIKVLSVGSANGVNNGLNGLNGHNSKNGNEKNNQIKQQQIEDLDLSDEDLVMNIASNGQKKNKKKNKKRNREHIEQKSESKNEKENSQPKKRVKFDLGQSKTREFFSYGKVSTQKMPDSRIRSPSKAAIKLKSALNKK